ncbi:hypothetical protein I7I53_02736 [Histoplasma capsulatum var. duboisii H88]|uniref:Uncharacterized protein n=1 Tax=Ajellomyces capsulatus (strain H88) TaxID=544711 RepID=A0A8A1LMB7_AJEC8|nr:hypothetical protein I7I53_02736 [Histoplasma capsulatum var. duboisii H88]
MAPSIFAAPSSPESLNTPRSTGAVRRVWKVRQGSTVRRSCPIIIREMNNQRNASEFQEGRLGQQPSQELTWTDTSALGLYLFVL